ncbi:MAG: bifunctional 3,4-dihydroxy-2-butanone-4-phosphate synthase/GTP cyclohydrolase II [Chloroflexi bacterium]|nr:bifunctional 3,4-dihydroxy-2-butanone-4-phosphate synthase/GTP cyclohydrolase II [Chloroflexota bacterium]
MPLATIAEALADLRQGRFVIVVDDEDRENEGDLVIAAQFCTAEAVNFMARYGRGLICVPLTGERLDALALPLMVAPDRNGTRFGTAFTVSVEARDGVTTGISAADRARTIQVLANPATTPSELVRPGHIFPLRAAPGGVLERAGQTEASVDLARLAGLEPVAVLCEIMRDDGMMARLPDLELFAAQHDLLIVSVADLIAHRQRTEPVVRRQVEAELPTDAGPFQLIAYTHTAGAEPDLALVMGDVAGGEPPLVRLHSECLTGDAFGSRRCDCGQQLQAALHLIGDERRGVLLYLRQEGRGIGLLNKLRAYHLQDHGLDTVEANEQLGFPADRRDYRVAARILADLGIARVRLLTNNPRKRTGLEDVGIAVAERVPLLVAPNAHNHSYLATKRDKLGHQLGALAGDD